MLHEILFALLGHTGSIIIELPMFEQAADFVKQMNIDQSMNGSFNRGQVAIGEGNYPILRFMVNPNLNFLSRAEVDQINKIVQLGAYVKMIQTFLAKFGGISSKMALQLAYKDDGDRKNRDANGNGSDMNGSLDGVGAGDEDNEDEEALQGVYIKAFCSGVSEILQVYKEHLLAIEAEYLKDRSMTIASLQIRLALY